MKKYYLFYLLIMLTLGGCAKYNNFFDQMYSSDSNIKIKTDETNNTKASQKDKDIKKPIVNLSLVYKPKTQEINANIKIDANKSYQDKIYFKWQAPKSSKCYSNSFMLILSKNYLLDAQSVLDSNNKLCNGLWIASIYNKDNKKVLAKATINV